MNDIEKFGTLLKSLREEKGLTLTQLGDLTGYSNPYLSQIESGKRKKTPSPELIKKLADALGNGTYVKMLEAAGYHELAERETLKSIYDDFGSEYSAVELHQRNQTLQRALDIKNLLEQKDIDFEAQNITPKYNGHLLTEQDQVRILKMLELLFPEYQKPLK
ncbi:helix-turn-helix transcriptional regulator [Lysinibacillus pakistanensis]|uniref:helix-turn-helix domain-containing protein n=1 Tax=Lysinibacillus pakistanensis TaxID=759811 RepID=UPI003D2BD22F